MCWDKRGGGGGGGEAEGGRDFVISEAVLI